MSLYVSPKGVPSPPDDLSNETADDLVSHKVKWNCPLNRGGGIVKYVIRISLISSYVGEETDNCPMGSSHTIRAGSISGVEFNTVYDVEVTAISVCGDESGQSNITVMINASECCTVCDMYECTNELFYCISCSLIISHM